MTTQQHAHPSFGLRTPLVALGLIATASVAFAAGAITFDGSGSSDSATIRQAESGSTAGYITEAELANIVDSAARVVPFDVAVELTTAEFLDAERKLHDAYIDAYLAGTVSGDSTGATVREFRSLTDAEVLAINREIHDAFFDAYAALYPSGSGLSTTGEGATGTNSPVPGTELTAAMVAEEHEAYISGLVP